MPPRHGHGGILSIRVLCIRTLPAEPAYAYGRTSAADACGTLRNDTQDFCPAAVCAVSYSGSVPSGTVFTQYKNNNFPPYRQTYRKILSTNFEHYRHIQEASAPHAEQAGVRSDFMSTKEKTITNKICGSAPRRPIAAKCNSVRLGKNASEPEAQRMQAS